ncbi:MAG: hypothetical protein JNL73_22180 [Anaerolineales bacterium]|nr:hypothetical protein [Anaerolineales bacterium]
MPKPLPRSPRRLRATLRSMDFLVAHYTSRLRGAAPRERARLLVWRREARFERRRLRLALMRLETV